MKFPAVSRRGRNFLLSPLELLEVSVGPDGKNFALKIERLRFAPAYQPNKLLALQRKNNYTG